jgi:hypothetical protein
MRLFFDLPCTADGVEGNGSENNMFLILARSVAMEAMSTWKFARSVIFSVEINISAIFLKNTAFNFFTITVTCFPFF